MIERAPFGAAHVHRWGSTRQPELITWMRAAPAVERPKGERTGGVPMGRRVEAGRLVVDGGEAAALARARELRSEGKPLREIAPTSAPRAGVPARDLRPGSRNSCHSSSQFPSLSYMVHCRTISKQGAPLAPHGPSRRGGQPPVEVAAWGRRGGTVRLLEQETANGFPMEADGLRT